MNCTSTSDFNKDANLNTRGANFVSNSAHFHHCRGKLHCGAEFVTRAAAFVARARKRYGVAAGVLGAFVFAGMVQR